MKEWTRLLSLSGGRKAFCCAWVGSTGWGSGRTYLQEGRVSKFKGRRLGTRRQRAGPGGAVGRAVEQRFEHLPAVWGLEELERCFCLFYFDFFSRKICLCNSPVLLSSLLHEKLQ